MRFKVFLFIIWTILGLRVSAQTPNLSERSQISLLTCAAGDELYYSFGHSAIRVQDPELGIDVVYNYGTFDFDRPNFYLNFVKGKLIYSLSRRTFDVFLYEYELEKRWVREQILDLTLEERTDSSPFLKTTICPRTETTCTTPCGTSCSSITGDILKDQYGDAIVFNGSHLDKQFTFRQLVRQHLDILTLGRLSE